MKNMPRDTRQVASAALCGLAVLSATRAAEAEDTGRVCSDGAEAMALDEQLVGGSAGDNLILEWYTGHAHFGDFAVARLLRGGSHARVIQYRHDAQLDASFGTSGIVLLDYRGGAAVCGPRSGT